MNRSGAALALALLVLLVLEGVVIGTVYLTVQEHRVVQNGVIALRLRFAAESAARAAAATWPAALDSLVPGALLPANSAPDTAGLMLRTIYQRVDSALVLVFAEAAEVPPRAGRARAALLIEPPLLSLADIPDAALTAGATVRLRQDAALVDHSEPACDDRTEPSPRALRMPSDQLLERDAAAIIDGAITLGPLASEWAVSIAQITATLAARGADLAYPDPTRTTVIAIDGDFTVPANTTFRGLLLVNGTLIIEAGAIIYGVVLATGPIDISGTISFSFCAARDALRAAGLHRPRPYAFRPSIPAF